MAKTTKEKLVRCYDCKKAELLQWGNDPIIARCSMTSDKDVAKSMRFCKEYEYLATPSRNIRSME